jgi:hypothetical protein
MPRNDDEIDVDMKEALIEMVKAVTQLLKAGSLYLLTKRNQYSKFKPVEDVDKLIGVESAKAE